MTTPDDSAPELWINGEIMPDRGAMIPAVRAGFFTGEGVFETLVTYGGEPFALGRHYERLSASGEALGLDVPPLDELRNGIGSILAESRGRRRLRITILRDIGTLITTGSAPEWPPAADVVTVPWTRNERGALAGIKSVSYAGNMRAREYARARGGGEAVFGNTLGHLCEGASSNVFLIEEGVLVTPPLESGCLPGVTRALVIAEAKRLGILVEERPSKLVALEGAEEAFLTSTTREVQPVARVDGRALGRVDGEITAALAAAYRELLPTEGPA
ncbi:aminodeoxychorismate lyase [soil metagenome]